MTKLLTVSGVAQILGVTKQTIYHHIRSGNLVPDETISSGGGQTRALFNEETIKAFQAIKRGPGRPYVKK